MHPVNSWISISPFPLRSGHCNQHSLLFYVSLSPVPHRSEILQHLFCVCLVPLSLLSSRLIHVVANNRFSYFLRSSIVYCLYILHYLFPGPNCAIRFIRADPLSFQVEMIETGLLGSIWHSWGSGSLMMLLFPLWGLSWHWAEPLWEKSDICRVWLFSASVIRLFAPLEGLGPLFWTSKFSQRHSHPGVVVKMMFLWEDECADVFCHLAGITALSVFDGVHWLSSVAHRAVSELTPLSSFFSYPVSSLSHFYCIIFKQIYIYIFCFPPCPYLLLVWDSLNIIKYIKRLPTNHLTKLPSVISWLNEAYLLLYFSRKTHEYRNLWVIECCKLFFYSFDNWTILG